MNNMMIISLLVAIFVSVTILFGPFLLEKDPKMFSSYRKLKSDDKFGIWILKVKQVSALSAIIMVGCTISVFGNSELGYFIFLLIPSLTASFYIVYIYINKMMEGKARRNCKIIIYITVAIMVAMISFLFYVHLSDLDINIGKNSILIKGLYKTEVKYMDMDKLEICEKYPNINLRTNGFSFMSTHLGYFRTVEGRNIMLQIHSSSPCIHIKMNNNKDIFLNSKENRKTKEIHKSISVAISAYKN